MIESGFPDTKSLLLIVHLLGIALGVGGAIISDLMFFRAVRDKRITNPELGFLRLGSRAVTAGLVLLILSGAGMFLLDADRYIESSKFLAKMTVVGIIALNGIAMHFAHIPRLRLLASRNPKALHRLEHWRVRVMATGTVSLVSWLTALVLGAFRSVPYEYGTIVGVYLAVLAVAFLGTLLLRDHFFPIRA